MCGQMPDTQEEMHGLPEKGKIFIDWMFTMSSGQISALEELIKKEEIPGTAFQEKSLDPAHIQEE